MEGFWSWAPFSSLGGFLEVDNLDGAGDPKTDGGIWPKKRRVWQTLTGQGRGAEIVLGSSVSQAEVQPVCRKSGHFSSAEGRSFCAPGQQCTRLLGGAVKRYWAAIWGYPWASLKPRVWAPLAAQPLLTTILQVDGALWREEPIRTQCALHPHDCLSESH